MLKINFYRAAKLYIDQYSVDAPIHAGMRADVGCFQTRVDLAEKTGGVAIRAPTWYARHTAWINWKGAPGS